MCDAKKEVSTISPSLEKRLVMPLRGERFIVRKCGVAYCFVIQPLAPQDRAQGLTFGMSDVLQKYDILWLVLSEH